MANGRLGPPKKPIALGLGNMMTNWETEPVVANGSPLKHCLGEHHLYMNPGYNPLYRQQRGRTAVGSVYDSLRVCDLYLNLLWMKSDTQNLLFTFLDMHKSHTQS